MKQILVTATAIVFSLAAFAQEVPPTKDTIPTEQQDTIPATQQTKSGFLMRDGKMYVIKAGTKTEQTEDVTLVNGTIVMVNGTVKSTNGQTVTLKDGQYIDLDGNIRVWQDQQ